MKYIILLLIPIMSLAQVGINTTTPTKTLDVNGELRIRTIPQGTTNDSILVVNNLGEVRRLAINQLNITDKCPYLIKHMSSPYYLLFKSDSSIPNPNNSLVINNINFVSAGTWIENNTYYYSYSNTSGKPLTINNFDVTFSTITCTYK